MLDIEAFYIIAGVIAALAAIITKTGRKIIAGIAAVAVAFALHGAARAEDPFKEVYGEIIAVDIDDGIVYVETDDGEIYSYFADGVITIGRVKLIIFGNDEVIDVELEQPSGCLLFLFFMRCVQPQNKYKEDITMMNRPLDPNKFTDHPEHGKVIRATREWGCANGREYWETWLKYEDNFAEYVDFTPGDHYDA